MNNNGFLQQIIIIMLLLPSFSVILYSTPVPVIAEQKIDLISIVHGQIHINGKDELMMSNLITSGEGNLNNPFILENVKIQTKDGPGLIIENIHAHLIIRNVTIESQGIHSRGSRNITFSNCTSEHNGKGMTFKNISNVTIVDHYSCNNGGTALNFWNARDSKIFNSTICSNKGSGIYLNHSTQFRIFNNIIYDNADYGIVLVNSSNDNRIYNNYFDNREGNYVVSGSSQNIWNLSKLQRSNIILGPYNGGNFWSDYAGTDMDGDELGDTELPYGPGDLHPLVGLPDPIKPGIDDNMSNPTTGERRYEVNVTVWDNRSVSMVFVEHAFDAASIINYSLRRNTGTHKNGTYVREFAVPSGAMNYTYRILARDTYGNWNSTSYKTVDVIDNDPPTIMDFTQQPINDKNLTFLFHINDNRKVAEATLEYWFDEQEAITVVLEKGIYTVKVSLDAKVLKYNVTVIDTSNNSILYNNTWDVKDATKPDIVDLTGIPYTGNPFSFQCQVTDNREINKVSVGYRFDSREDSGTMEKSEETYIYNLTVPARAMELSYTIYARDMFDNVGKVSNTIDVIDVINPIIERVSYEQIAIMTGEQLEIDIEASDNWEVIDTRIEYWFDNGTHINESYTWDFMIDIPLNSTILHMIVSAIDSSGNIGTLERTEIVLDDIEPTIEDLSGEPTTGDDFWIVTNITDNVGINNSYLEYGIDNKQLGDSIPYNGTYWISIPEDGETIYFVITTWDLSYNNKLLEVEKQIIDNDAPIIQDLTNGTPERAHYFQFDVLVIDNRELKKVCLNYGFGEDELGKCEERDSGNFSFKVLAKREWAELHYSFSAWDSSNNLNMSGETVLVIGGREPINPPSLLPIPDQDITVGEKFRLKAQVKETDSTEYSNLTFNLKKAPAGMSIDPSSGLINWTPERGQEGKYEVVVEVTDSIDADRQTFKIRAHPKKDTSITMNSAWAMWVILSILLVAAMVFLSRGLMSGRSEDDALDDYEDDYEDEVSFSEE